MLTSLSPLQRLREDFRPALPELLKNLAAIDFFQETSPPALHDVAEIKKHFPLTYGQPVLKGEKGKGVRQKPLRVGVVLSGGQAAGGHNVIAGLFDALRAIHQESKLYGFLNGPSGIVEGKEKEITAEFLAPYRNMGGFDLIGSGRTKIETGEQLDSAHKVVEKLRLDGLVIIGGDDSNTNAAVLAEYFLSKKCKTKVVGVPKTIDGDLKNAYVDVSFGFDTACKVYAELIGNIARDAFSAKKYYHFIKLMGRTASHITLECAIATHPNWAIISEECAAKNKTLKEIVSELSDMISKRAEQGKNYGVILIPEGLVEFLPDIKALIRELSALNPADLTTPQSAEGGLSPATKATYNSLPASIQKQLILERDPHGNVQVSLIETELLLIELVKKELAERNKRGVYKGKFAAQHHFLGYEGRSGYPSNFDANYCNALGYSAALLLAAGFTGYMAAVFNLASSASNWNIAGVPLTMLMHLEERSGKMKAVIQKALVDLKGRAFFHFSNARGRWALEDLYRFPGPIQFFGDSSVTETIPLSLTV